MSTRLHLLAARATTSGARAAQPTAAFRRIAALAPILVAFVLAAAGIAEAQTPNPYVTPGCVAPPNPANDTWPVAVTDQVTMNTASLEITNSMLLSNDRGSSLQLTSLGPRSAGGGVVTGTGPYVFTVPAGFSGPDVLPYEISDGDGQTAIGLVKVNVIVADTTAPSASISAPAAAAVVSGTVLVTASATDNVGVVGVRVFDGTTQIGAELTRAPFRASWNTTAVGNGPHSLWARARDAAGNTVDSASISVTVTNIAVPSVIGQTQAAAQSTLSTASLATGGVTIAGSTVAAGSVLSQSPTPGTLVAPNTAVSLVVSSGPGGTARIPVLDKKVTVTGKGTRTTTSFSTAAAGEVLLAFVMSDGPSTTTAQNMTVSGGGLTWRRVQRATVRAGVVEIWTATAPAKLTDVKITSTPSAGDYRQSLVVLTFTGAGGIGASAIRGAATGAPTISLTTLGANSLVFAAGADRDRALARTIPAGQTKVNEFLETSDGNTFWVQSTAGAVTTAGTPVTLNATAPTTDQWNLAIVELLGAGLPQ